MKKPKNIAIFCDGTWNKSDSRNPTNVVRLAQSLHHFTEDGVTPQIIIYLPGVGTGKGTGRVARFLDKVLGGILGWGLLENIADAYRALIFNYEPGDRIYLFGFSRGAYTARSLGGLIRKAGILQRSDVHRVPEAIALYKLAGDENRPDEPHIQAARAELSPLVATSEKDAEMRGGDPLVLRIAYMGVWDTVGALGVPSALPLLARPLNKKYEFHDAELSSSVATARHAVAIDERRRTFPPAVWTNLDKLNDRYPAAVGSPDNYRQLWFAGDHASVGGGGAHVGLSRIAMDFIAEGAAQAGLHIAQPLLEYVPTELDCRAPTDSAEYLTFVTRMLRRWSSDRDELRDANDVADAVLMRIRLMGKTYNPGTLRSIRQAVEARAMGFNLLPPDE